MGGFVNCEWNDKKLLCSQDMPINGDGDFFIFGSHEYQLQPEWHHHIDYKMLCTLVNCTTFIYYSTVSKKWATHTSVSFSSMFSHTHTHTRILKYFFPLEALDSSSFLSVWMFKVWAHQPDVSLWVEHLQLTVQTRLVVGGSPLPHLLHVRAWQPIQKGPTIHFASLSFSQWGMAGECLMNSTETHSLMARGWTLTCRKQVTFFWYSISNGVFSKSTIFI